MLQVQEDVMTYENDLVSSMIDFNFLIKMMLKIMTPRERRLLATKVEDNNIDKYLSDGIRSDLFNGLDRKGLSKYSSKAWDKVLGLIPKDVNCFVEFRRWEDLRWSLFKKLSRVISENGFDNNFNLLGTYYIYLRKSGVISELNRNLSV